MRLNDRPYENWHEGLTIRGVMDYMHFTWPKLVVKVNGQLVWPEDYGNVVLRGRRSQDPSFAGRRLSRAGMQE